MPAQVFAAPPARPDLRGPTYAARQESREHDAPADAGSAIGMTSPGVIAAPEPHSIQATMTSSAVLRPVCFAGAGLVDAGSSAGMTSTGVIAAPEPQSIQTTMTSSAVLRPVCLGDSGLG